MMNWQCRKCGYHYKDTMRVHQCPSCGQTYPVPDNESVPGIPALTKVPLVQPQAGPEGAPEVVQLTYSRHSRVGDELKP